ELGRGGMAVVYEAEQEALGRHVALKVLPSDAVADATRLERFRREARSAARLHHTNIVPVFDIGEWRGVYYLALQVLPGHDPDRVLAELKRLRAGPAAGLPTAHPAGSLACCLLSGRFPPEGAALDAAEPDPLAVSDAPGPAVEPDARPSPGGKGGSETATST